MSQPSQVRPSSISRTPGSTGSGDRQFPFTPPAVQAWLARHAQEPAEERRSLRLRLAVVEHDLGRGLDLDGRDDFRCLARRGLEPSDAVVTQALALLRDLGPRALCCDEDGDAGRFALAIAAAELIERGQCDSLLVICPERDCADWIERLQQGFGLPARLCTEERISDLAGGGAWVMTHATAVARAQQVHDRGFGVVLLDEIHACGRDAVRALRHALREEMFLFARTSSPLHEGFTTLYRALDLVRGPVAHPLGTWEEFVSLFLGGDATAQFPRKGTEDELRARLSAWMHREARNEGGDAGKSKTKRAVKEHFVEPLQREKEYLELAWRAALGFPEGTRGHYLAAAIGGPWAFAEAVERAIARNLVAEPALRRVLQDLVVRGRSMRETAKTAQLAQIVRKVQKDRDARVLVCVRSGATATGITHALAQAGFMDQTEVLKEGQDGLNRMAIQRFVLGERRVLIAPDGAARGIVVHCVTDLVHFGPALEPAEHVARLERLGSEDGARCTVHRLILRGTPEESAVHAAQQRLGFHDLEAEQVGSWLGDLGLGASADGWSRFLLGRVAATLEGKPRDEELLPLLEQRKQAEAFRSDRRRAADRVLGALGRTQRTARARYESDAPRHTVAQLVAASLELRQGGWQVTDDKRILLEHEGRHSELRVPERSGRTLSQPPTEDTKYLECEPGSWAWERLTAKFREGSSFFLADARAYPLDRVRKKLAAKLEPHGLVIESLAVAEAHETVAASLNLRATAHAGPERHEALVEARSCAEGHQLDAYLDAPETLPWPDGSRTPMIGVLDGAVAEAVEEAFARAADDIESLVRGRSDLKAFLGAAAARPANSRPAPEFGVGASVEGLTGLLYQTVTVEARVRHRDQTAAWPIRVRCVPVSGVILGEIPLPADAAPGAPLWACAAGHLVAAGAIHACATPGCTTGLCSEHAGADAGLHQCEDCGAARCSEHSSACAGCGSALCAEHLEELDSGSRACGKCAQTLEDGRRYLADEIAWSAVSRRAGPKSELERSALSGRWGFPAEMVTCEVSGRRLLPDEVANCARSHKRVARDLLFQDPISGLLCQDEYFVPSCVSNARALPESMVRSAVSGRLALPEEIRACSCCDARILPDEGAECPETGAFACPRHMRRCAESGAMTLPEGLGRCQISGAEVRHGLLRICAETGKRARPQFFETCASSGASVLPDGMETCAATGRRVRRSLLQTCAVTGQKVMPEHLGTCSVSGRRVVKDLLVACAETGVLMTKERAVPCDETGAPCAPEALEVCASTKRRARRSLLAVDEVSGQRVLARLLRKCVRTGKRTLADRFDSCSVSNAQVLATELIECQETGRRALPDKLERCAATGVLAHPDQFITCAATRRRVLRRVAETCEVSGELAAPGALEACTITGKRVLPALLGVNEVTGSKVLKELLVSCERTGRKTLRENLVRSAVSGVEITQDIAVHCELTGAPALPEELAACAATGKRVLPSLLGTCQVSGDKVLEEYLQTCEASGKRVRPDLLQTCSRTGRRVLPQHLGVSRLSGELGVKELLVTCEATRRQVFPDELVLSERSGKRIGRDRAVHCAVSGLVVDVGETEVCSLCRQPASGSEVYEGVCSACIELVGRKQGVAAGLATVAALQRDCDWAGSLRATVHGDTVRVLARRRAFGAFRSPWLVVLRRPGPHGPGAPAPVPAAQGEDGDQGDGEHPELEVVQQERVSAETAKTLRRLVREQARLHREHEKEQRRRDPEK